MVKKLFIITFILLGLGQVLFGQKNVSPAKKKLVSQLAANTTEMFPIDVYNDFLNSAIEKGTAEKGKEIVDELTKSLEASNWSDEKKEAVKLKIPAFVERLLKISKNLLSKDFNVRNWAIKSLEKNCHKQFTIAQLQKLNKYFSSSDGKAFVLAFKRITASEITGGQKDSFTTEEKERFEQMPTVTGEAAMTKFFDVVVINVMNDMNDSITVWGKTMLKNMESEFKDGLLKIEADKFIAENQ